jgi:uncharacterized membrane protein
MKRLAALLLLLAVLLGGWHSSAAAADPVIRAVFFYSPTCEHCHEVMENVLPPLKAQYGAQLDIVGIDVNHPVGQTLYNAMVNTFQVPDNRIGVPTLVVGSMVMVGSDEIPAMLPDIIKEGLTIGGIDWPAIPGLSTVLAVQTGAPPAAPAQDSRPLFIQNFLADPVGNSVAVVVLLLMVALVVYVLLRFLANRTDRIMFWPNWTLPVISIVGLGIAGYLAYIEITEREAICSPGFDCGKVQTSEYAYLFGVIPVGVLGMIGYLGILGYWALKTYGPPSTRRLSILILWGMAWFGILFSIYLTFLEPFVIGATCVWCLGSALLMTLAFLATSGPAIQALSPEIEDDEEDEEE